VIISTNGSAVVAVDQKPIKARTIKARPVSGTHTRAAVSEIRKIFKALLSIDLSEIITVNFLERKSRTCNSGRNLT
jgi:hypothetical protein